MQATLSKLLSKKLIIVQVNLRTFSKSDFPSARIHNSNCTARISQQFSNKFSVTIVLSLTVSQMFLCRSFKQLLLKKLFLMIAEFLQNVRGKFSLSFML